METSLNPRKLLLSTLDKANREVESAREAVYAAQLDHRYAENVQTAINHVLRQMPNPETSEEMVREMLEYARDMHAHYVADLPSFLDQPMNSAACRGLIDGYAKGAEVLAAMLSEPS